MSQESVCYKRCLLALCCMSVCFYLSAEGVDHRHPEVLGRVVAVDAFGKAAAHVHQAVQRHGRDVALAHGNVGAQQPAVCLWVITLHLRVTYTCDEHEDHTPNQIRAGAHTGEE